MDQAITPVFAVVGHPNEGKSAVVSTLTEDDSVAVSPVPGETRENRVFPFVVDQTEIIRFVDTPGFQRPKAALEWLQTHGDGPDPVAAFVKEMAENPDFSHEVRLLTPVARGAGVIYVVDASRPMRSQDVAEMEILRLSGRPRMAVINFKEKNDAWLNQWKTEFRRQFNAVRVFSAHTASYSERMALLESLRSIDQDWEAPLNRVISAFANDWRHRTRQAAGMLTRYLSDAVSHTATSSYSRPQDRDKAREKAWEAYQHALSKMEKAAHKRIRALYKHNLFQPVLPVEQMLGAHLLDKTTWKVLGLSPNQLAAMAGAAGAAVGAVADTAAAGLTFGIFTSLGAAAGAASAFFGGKKIASTKVKGIRLGGWALTMGPAKNPQLLFVALDRSLIHYHRVINWAHGRRDFDRAEAPEAQGLILTKDWRTGEKSICRRFFYSRTTPSPDFDSNATEMAGLLEEKMLEMAGARSMEVLPMD